MVPYGIVWSCMILYGPVWSHFVLLCPVWSVMVLFGPVWSHMVPFGLLWLIRTPLYPYATLVYFFIVTSKFQLHFSLGDTIITVHNFALAPF